MVSIEDVISGSVPQDASDTYIAIFNRS